MSAKARWKLIAGSLLALVSVSVIAVYSAPTQANGRVARLARQVAGPYEIALGTVPGRPVVGALHMTMTATDISSGDFVFDAEITVAAIGPGTEAIEIGPVQALTNPSNPAFYDVNTSVDRVGFWTFTVSVNSALGEASTDFAIKVETASPLFRVLSWVTLLVFFSFVGLGVLPFIRARGRRKKPQRRPTPRRKGRRKT